MCVVVDDGLLVFDACPSRVAFTEFAAGPGFAAAVAAAGLPALSVEPLGGLHRVVARAEATR